LPRPTKKPSQNKKSSRTFNSGPENPWADKQKRRKQKQKAPAFAALGLLGSLETSGFPLKQREKQNSPKKLGSQGYEGGVFSVERREK
jgi:hypothetical protein